MPILGIQRLCVETMPDVWVLFAPTKADVGEWALRSGEPEIPITTTARTFWLHNLRQLVSRPCSQGDVIKTKSISSLPCSKFPHGFLPHSELKPVSFQWPSRPYVICRTLRSLTDSTCDILFLPYPTPAPRCMLIGPTPVPAFAP